MSSWLALYRGVSRDLTERAQLTFVQVFGKQAIFSGGDQQSLGHTRCCTSSTAWALTFIATFKFKENK
jgi:hypothetical protein